jgi:hypothetical protein
MKRLSRVLPGSSSPSIILSRVPMVRGISILFGAQISRGPSIPLFNHDVGIPNCSSDVPTGLDLDVCQSVVEFVFRSSTSSRSALALDRNGLPKWLRPRRRQVTTSSKLRSSRFSDPKRYPEKETSIVSKLYPYRANCFYPIGFPVQHQV